MQTGIAQGLTFRIAIHLFAQFLIDDALGFLFELSIDEIVRKSIQKVNTLYLVVTGILDSKCVFRIQGTMLQTELGGEVCPGLRLREDSPMFSGRMPLYSVGNASCLWKTGRGHDDPVPIEVSHDDDLTWFTLHLGRSR